MGYLYADDGPALGAHWKLGLKSNLIGITRALAVSGVTDFSFVDEESKFRGSEVHRICELSVRGTLARKSVPVALRGYLDATERFMHEARFIPMHVEKQVQCRSLGVRGRIDLAGFIRGVPTLVEWKTGAIQPAVALQLCLGGHLLEPGKWWNRVAVRLNVDGTYSPKIWPLKMWASDLSTALACARVARWKIQNRLA